MEKSNRSEDFSILEGGPFSEALMKLGFLHRKGMVALIVLCITFFPLLIITTIEGTLYTGTQLPFLKDIAMLARILVALPMLILIKPLIGNKVSDVLKHLTNTLMNTEEKQEITKNAVHRARVLANSAITDIIVSIIVIIGTIIFVREGVFSELEEGTTAWMVVVENGIQALSIAGYWAVIVAIPMFQFLILKWIWRYIVWILLLFRLSKSNLNLLPTHPDRSGGLGNIIQVQRSFNLIFVVVSIVLSGEFIGEITKYPDIFNTLRSEVIGYIVICLFMMIFPLLFFTGKLVNTKEKGLLDLSNLGAGMSRKFESDWVNDLSLEKRITEHQVDPSIVFDFAGIYDSLQHLPAIPATVRDIIGMALMLFVPFIPILFIHFSIAELVQKIIGLLL